MYKCRSIMDVLQIRAVKRCFWMGGGLTVWAAQPTYRRVWGQASLRNIFYVYALKSILVHSETNNINRNHI